MEEEEGGEGDVISSKGWKVAGGRTKEEGGRRGRKEEGGRAERSGAEIVNLKIRDFPVAVLRRAILTRAQAGEGGFTRYPCISAHNSFSLSN